MRRSSNYEMVDGFGDTPFLPGFPAIPSPLGVSDASFEAKNGLWVIKPEAKAVANQVFASSIVNAPQQVSDPFELTVQLDISGKPAGGNVVIDALMNSGVVILVPKNPQGIATGKILATKTASIVQQMANVLTGVYGIYGGPQSVIDQASVPSVPWFPVPIPIPGVTPSVPGLPQQLPPIPQTLPTIPVPSWPEPPRPGPAPAPPPVQPAPAKSTGLMAVFADAPPWVLPATMGLVAVAVGVVVYSASKGSSK